MRIDLTLKVDMNSFGNFAENEKMINFGHLGTHFDSMGTDFSMDYWKLPGILIPTLTDPDQEIGIESVEKADIAGGEFVLFHTGFLEKTGYGSSEYFDKHPQLSKEIIDYLIEKKIKMIGIDAPGVRRGEEHTPTDKYCSDHKIFIVENLDNLSVLHKSVKNRSFEVYTAPVNFSGLSGLPCRVIAEF